MENIFKELSYRGKQEKIIQFISESNKVFDKRVEFIRKMETKNIDWKEASRLSRIWYCINYKNCRYNPIIYNKIKNLDK